MAKDPGEHLADLPINLINTPINIYTMHRPYFLGSGFLYLVLIYDKDKYIRILPKAAITSVCLN